jgi:hypothetical protein
VEVLVIGFTTPTGVRSGGEPDCREEGRRNAPASAEATTMPPGTLRAMLRNAEKNTGCLLGTNTTVTDCRDPRGGDGRNQVPAPAAHGGGCESRKDADEWFGWRYASKGQ